MRLSKAEPDEDLLAQREQEEFEASVRSVRERAAKQVAFDASPLRTAPPEGEDDDIVWSEQEDVYRPRPIDAHAYVASLSRQTPLRLRAGKSEILIREPAYDLALDHLRSDLTVELGGLLAGEALYDPKLDLFIVVIEAAFPALNGDGTATSFTYTPAAWEAMLPAWERMKREWTIVGSYHSHPGLGVFLSSVDRATQLDVFPHDWQVAIVIDPIANITGCFIGSSGKPCSFTVL